MSIVSMLKSKELTKILLKAGFKIIRQSGSHIRLRHTIESNRQTTVPVHNADIPRALLRIIIKQAGISVEELLELLS